MSKTALRPLLQIAAIVAATASLSACNALSRLSEVGSGPQVSSIENPTQRPGYQPVSMPMPAAQQPPQNANSLWRPGSRAFFKDQRAKDVGDILTVSVSTNDSATVTSGLTNTRESGEDTNTAFNLLGFESSLRKILPDAVDPANLVDFSSDSKAKNSGSTTRGETLTVNMAATITQVLPNGNLVIQGKQEIRVNYEMREVSIQGIIRPADISSTNTVASNKIAEARIAYGGRGIVSDMAQPRYGQQIFDILFPF